MQVQWLRTKFDVQKFCFEFEIHHLVMDTLDAEKAQLMKNDHDHAYWTNKDIDGTLAKHMGELYPKFTKAIQEVKAALVQIEDELPTAAVPPHATVSSAVPKIALITANSVSTRFELSLGRGNTKMISVTSRSGLPNWGASGSR
jgi:hypothetical protein